MTTQWMSATAPTSVASSHTLLLRAFFVVTLCAFWIPFGAQMKSIASLLLIVACSAIAQVPRPDHIVIVIEENHDRSQIIQSYINGVEQAPYIDSLAADIGPSGHTADFTRSFDTGHGYPSQPNYLQFYSGDNQGCTDDYFPIAGSPFITANLARELLNTGLTFVAYSENRLGQGYVARHDPSRNWEGNGQNQIPPSTHADFSAFPSNFSQLPAVSYVIPTVMHDMHSPPPPPPPQPDLRVPTGDQWLRDHMDAYVQWCKTHNSLFILTFDEGHSGDGPICTLIIGEKIQGGQYAEAARNGIDHYSVLRTIEDAYGLPHAGPAITGLPAPTPAPIAIDNIWRGGLPTPTPTPTASPGQCVVPNLVGLIANKTRAPWKAAGFSSKVQISGHPNGRVILQSIPAGTHADCDSTVMTVTTN